VKSEYGSTLDGEDQRTADVVDALNAAAAFRPSEYLYVFFSCLSSLYPCCLVSRSQVFALTVATF
jgi:hypothetical protein